LEIIDIVTDWQDLQADYDAWVTLGNPGWGWDDLLPYFKKVSNPSAKYQKLLTLLKSENYTDNVNSHFSRELYIKPSASTHGSDGYVHVSYPRYFYNQSRTLSINTISSI
jgi:choline dehydrogenase